IFGCASTFTKAKGGGPRPLKATGHEERTVSEDELPRATSVLGHLPPSIDMPQWVGWDEDRTKKRVIKNLDRSNDTMSQEDKDTLQSPTPIAF
ncbi:MAG: hypothetical protein Q9175_003334, partial [Cornicularia normoerica]